MPKVSHNLNQRDRIGKKRPLQIQIGKAGNQDKSDQGVSKHQRNSLKQPFGDCVMAV